jgi:NADH:ubiquinone oxidoreductase subunit C
MPSKSVASIASRYGGNMLPLKFQPGWKIAIDRARWLEFFVAIHNEESLRPCQLRMLGGKSCSFGVTIFAELYFPLGEGRFVVSCDLSLADTLPSLRDIWSYADWMEQEIFELYGARIGGTSRSRRMFTTP